MITTMTKKLSKPGLSLNRLYVVPQMSCWRNCSAQLARSYGSNQHLK